MQLTAFVISMVAIFVCEIVFYNVSPLHETFVYSLAISYNVSPLHEAFVYSLASFEVGKTVLKFEHLKKHSFTEHRSTTVNTI